MVAMSHALCVRLYKYFIFQNFFIRIFEHDFPAYLHHYFKVIYTWIEFSRPPLVPCLVKNLKSFPKKWFSGPNIALKAIWVDSVWIKHLKRVLPPCNMLNRSWKLVVDLVEKKYLVKTYIAYESLFHIMVHVKWPSPNIKVDLDHETDDFMKKRFYQRNLQPSKHPKRVGTKQFFFSLLDGPLLTV